MTEASQSNASAGAVPLASETIVSEHIISLYEAQKKVYPRSILGPLAKKRWVMVWLTQLFFYGMPWIQWGQRQALLFDIDAKQFFIFGLVLYPQDLIYLTLLLIISAFSLFLFTAIAGRLWCGYTCPQTVYTEIFLWIEAKIEGDRAARIKLDNAPLSVNKLTKKILKQLAWILFALLTGFTFVGYFTPIRELASDFLAYTPGGWDAFWVMFYGLATYGNAGYLREQVCKYMCPYARFQSVMFDDDTMVVTYDESRGEPRGKLSKQANNLADNKPTGHCIECSLCVQVCPTGIDIRDGMQIECIGCGLCADVCDDVMEKVDYPKGLIRYSTINGLENKWTKSQMLKRIFRPRVLIYMGILFVLITGMGASLYFKKDFNVNVIRDRGVLARLDGSMLENVYRLQIMNASEEKQRYHISATGLNDMHLGVGSGAEQESNHITVGPAQVRGVAVDIEVPDGSLETGSHQVVFTIEALTSGDKVIEKSTFIVPR